MASISSQINLIDRMSSPLLNITNALDGVISSLQRVDSNINDSFDTGAIDSARRSLDLANKELDEMSQNLTETTNKQNKLNKEIQDGCNKMDSLTDGVVGMVAAYAGFQGISKMVEMSDTMALTTARLDLMNDGLQTTEELQNKIFAAAQRSRGAYQDMADVVSKLGLQAKDAFTSNDEMIAFSELLNKNFIVGGSDSTAQAAAMYQLTQAMASGKLQGDEYRSIIENAPLLAKSIEDYMVNVQGATGSMKDWASEGLLTADVIKAAVFNSADDINAKFESMPMTWGQVWTGIMNEITMAMKPVLSFVNLLAQNWSILEPIVMGVVTALGLYIAALLVYKTITGVSAIVAGVHAAATAMQTGATFAATAAQYGFNAALLACPLTWILLIIIAVIAAIYGIVAAINKVTGSTISATGIIVGALTTAVAFIWNLFLGLLDLILGIINYLVNPWIAFANFFGNLFNDPIGAIVHLFGDLADNVLGIVETIAKALDKVFGSNLASTVQGWRSGLDTMVENVANEYGNGSYEKVANELNLSSESLGLKRWAYGDAWDAGYAFGEGIENTVGGFFGDGLGGTFDELTNGVSGINENTENISDSLDITSEDLKYLKDLAERDTINRFTTAEIRIEQTNNNNINSELDIDGVVNKLTIGVEEAMEKATEGVHY